MIGKPTDSARSRGNRHNRRFLQPLAVALVFLLFGLLFFSMAMVDLGRLEGLLLNALNKKALYVAEVIEKSSGQKYKRLLRHGDDYQSLYTGLAIGEEAFSLQEALARALIDVAGYIDSKGSDETADRASLQDLAASESLRAIALFDEKGLPTYQTHPLPPDLAAHAKALVEGRDEIAIHLFHGMKEKSSVGFVVTWRHISRAPGCGSGPIGGQLTKRKKNQDDRQNRMNPGSRARVRFVHHQHPRWRCLPVCAVLIQGVTICHARRGPFQDTSRLFGSKQHSPHCSSKLCREDLDARNRPGKLCRHLVR